RSEAELDDVDPVVALAVDEDDREATALIGRRVFRDAALIRRRLHGHALQRKRVRPGDAAANDVRRLGGRGAHRGKYEKQKESQIIEGTAILVIISEGAYARDRIHSYDRPTGGTRRRPFRSRRSIFQPASARDGNRPSR